jgi:hypothetical protein
MDLLPIEYNNHQSKNEVTKNIPSLGKATAPKHSFF